MVRDVHYTLFPLVHFFIVSDVQYVRFPLVHFFILRVVHYVQLPLVHFFIVRDVQYVQFPLVHIVLKHFIFRTVQHVVLTFPQELSFVKVTTVLLCRSQISQ